MPKSEFEAYGPVELSSTEMLAAAVSFSQTMLNRRSVREFDSRPVPTGVIEQCLCAANSAPSGANRQPWHFSLVRDPVLKKRIREAAEAEEQAFYQERAPQEWLEAIAPLGTDASKPFLESAPCLIVIFTEKFQLDAMGQKTKNYYVNESVGIATGVLIAALQHAGLATLTHTPSPMKFLNAILERPNNEKPFLILVTGYAKPGVLVPKLRKKALADVVTLS